jgi:hypothetical protein
MEVSSQFHIAPPAGSLQYSMDEMLGGPVWLLWPTETPSPSLDLKPSYPAFSVSLHWQSYPGSHEKNKLCRKCWLLPCTTYIITLPTFQNIRQIKSFQLPFVWLETYKLTTKYLENKMVSKYSNLTETKNVRYSTSYEATHMMAWPK